MFPLLDLPEDALRKVLKNSDRCSLVLLSVLSRRTMNLVKSIKLKLRHLCVALDNRVQLHLKFTNLEQVWISLDPNGDSADLGMLNSDSIGASSSTDFLNTFYFYWENPDVREWIDHFHYICSYHYIDIKFFNISNILYCLESMVRTLKGIPIQILNVCDTFDNFKTVLHYYFPISRVLKFNSRDYWGAQSAPRPRFMAKLLIQNFDAVHFEPFIPITLNNLLMMNAQFILSEVPKLSDKELNMYIRLWLKNTSSKLEYLKLVFHRLLHVPNENQQIRILNENLIFKGVDYIERSRNSTRLFEFSFDFDPSSYSQWKVINGGFDIKRQDDTMCTVLINSNYSSFEMFVWP